MFSPPEVIDVPVSAVSASAPLDVSVTNVLCVHRFGN